MTRNKITTTAITFTLLLLSVVGVTAQQKTDTVILNVGKSKIIFLIKDKADLRSMQDYDLNEILDQLSVKLTGDSTLIREDGSSVGDTTVVAQNTREPEEETIENTEPQDINLREEKKKRLRIGTRHSINFDLGVNNYLTPERELPDESSALYAVKPLGSWYVGINSIYNTRIVGPFYLEWGGGVSWYNFKFDNASTRLVDLPDRITFTGAVDPEVNFKKSKLTAFYVQFMAVPMFDFGRPSRHDSRIWKDIWSSGNNHSRGFRIGFGGYAGYKIDSYSKVVIDNGDKEKQRNHDSYHLESFRYGARLQIGFRDTDLFFNYDLNELFVEGQGPQLNAFSFGIIF